MQITSAIVLLAVYWFMVLFIVLPLRLKTQGDAGERLIGTSASSPAEFDMRRKLLVVTAIAVPLWAITSAIIIWGGITVEDFDLFRVFLQRSDG